MKKTILFTIFIFLFFACATTEDNLSPIIINGKTGYINAKLEVKIPPVYEKASIFSPDGFACVKTKSKNYEIIDKKGSKILELVTPAAWLLGDGLCAFYNMDRGVGIVRIKDNKNIAKQLRTVGCAFDNKIPVEFMEHPSSAGGFIDYQGDRVFPFLTIRNAKGYREGLSVVVNTDFSYSIIDSMGKEVAKERYKKLDDYYSEGLIWGQTLKNEIGAIDKKGSMVFSLPVVIEDNTFNATPFYKGISFVQTKDVFPNWAIINTKGEYIINNIPIVSANSFIGGYCKVFQYDEKKNLKIGFMDTAGRFLSNEVFDEAEDFSYGFARITKNGRNGVINTQGTIFWSDEIFKDPK